jgi:hypothetical protein
MPRPDGRSPPMSRRGETRPPASSAAARALRAAAATPPNSVMKSRRLIPTMGTSPLRSNSAAGGPALRSPHF